MSAYQWSTLKSRFLELSDLPSDRQQAKLEAIATTEPELADELTALLQTVTPNIDSITHSVQSLVTEMTDSALDNRIGMAVGNFRITAHLAYGGMGDVFLAERSDGTFEQQVAIKLMRTGFRSKEDLRRFDSERRILARLDHPGIARVLDGGSAADGAAYLVMEYVDGLAIDAYCREHALSLRDRIALFREVCAAVGFAHSNLIVHRDIKPSNILITRDGQPKLLDFGIAKPITPDDDSADVTELAARAMTPDYASPEQVLGQPVTTRSDVYSLGVLLYELLTGRRPYSTAGMRASERESVICETDPARPSAKAPAPGDFDPNEHTFAIEPAALRGDIDEIVMTALRKQPGERYQSVQALSDDLARYLNGQPVSARGRHWSYVLRKFLRRNALPMAGAVCVVVGATVALAYHTRAVAKERDLAQTEALKAKAVASFLTDIFAAPAPELAGANATARQVVDAGAQRLRTELKDQPAIRAQMLNALGDVYGSLGDYQLSISQHSSAKLLHEQSNDLPGIIRSLRGIARAFTGLRNHEDATNYLQEAIELERQRQPGGSAVLVDLIMNLAWIHLSDGDFRGTEQQIRQSLQLHEQLGLPRDDLYAKQLSALGDALQLAGDFTQSEIVLRDALEILDTHVSPTSSSRLDTLQVLGVVLVQLNKLDDAEPMFLEILDVEAEVFGENNPSLDNTMVQLGRLYRKRNEVDKAELWLRRAVEHSTRTRGRKVFDTAYDLNELSMLLHIKGDFAGADAGFREALDIYTEVLDPKEPYIAALAAAYSTFMIDYGKPTEALALAEQAEAITSVSLPDGHWLHANSVGAIGLAQQALGNYQAAVAPLTMAFGQLSESRPGNGSTIKSGEALLEVYGELGRDNDANVVREQIRIQKEIAGIP
ncbi:MAG: serine/threonine-protein kinase [Pseudomonadota bacterium]